MRRHRRGLFAAINVGLSYGKGLAAPTSLDTKMYAPLVDRLLANTDIIRMANFASGKLSFNLFLCLFLNSPHLSCFWFVGAPATRILRRS